jgi:hypothetical protein
MASLRAAGRPAALQPTPPAGEEAVAARAVEEGFFRVQPRARRPLRRPEALALPSPTPARGTEVAPVPPAEELPHLLARDATTLFVFWDFRRDLERGAAFGLSRPRVRFRLFDGEALVRTVEAPLERRSLYLEGLEPGHSYSVEAWLAGSDGHARPTGRRSAAIQLAPAQPSTELAVRLVRVPWGEPLAQWRETPAEGAPGTRVEPLGAPSRVELPSSLDWRGGPGPARGPGAPRSGRP